MTREEAIKIVKTQYPHDHVMKTALGMLIPELRESEDERIRKEIVDFIKSHSEDFKYSTDCWDMLAYLEKQKELTPVDGWEYADKRMSHPLYLEGFEAGRAVERELSEFEKQKEQKPAEWHPEDEQNLNVCLSYIKDESLRSWLIDAIHVRYDMPVEWSEEDEKMIDTIVSVLGQYIDYKAVSGTGSGYATPRYSKEIDWLKSLRPSWKPSELEKGALRTAIHILTDERNFPKAAKQLQNILDAFEGKESRKDWKPSEEQMEALCLCIPKSGQPCTLQSLYNDLKKLM